MVLLILLFSYMHSEWPPKDRPEPERTDIFFGGEYVMLGDTPEPAASDLAASQPAAVDPADAPKADNSTDPERLTTTDLESPAKKQKSPADGADEAARRAEQKKKKRRNAAAPSRTVSIAASRTLSAPARASKARPMATPPTAPSKAPRGLTSPAALWKAGAAHPAPLKVLLLSK